MVDERTIHTGNRVILTRRQKCVVEERLGIVGVLCEDERRYSRLLTGIGAYISFGYVCQPKPGVEDFWGLSRRRERHSLI